MDGEVLLGDLFRSGFEITDAQEEVRREAGTVAAWAAADGVLQTVACCTPA